MKGKIVLVPFPFTDLTAAKLRPALVVYEDKIATVLKDLVVGELGELDEESRQEVAPVIASGARQSRATREARMNLATT